MKRNDGFEEVVDTDFDVQHQIDDSYTMNTLHFHDVFEIYFAKTGGLRYFVDNRIYPVEENDLFVFNHLDLHRISISPGQHYDRYIVIFSRDYIRDLSTDTTDLLKCFLNRDPGFIHRVHLSNEQAELYLGLLNNASRYMAPCQYGEDVHKKIALAEMLIFVNGLYKDNNTAMLVRHDKAYEKVKPILNYIDDNVGTKLTLDTLENTFYISKFHLCKIFKEVTGLTVNNYIVYRRVLRATEYLRKNYPVSQVSEMTGFQNDCHFITTFKSIVGTTPKQYSKKTM